MLKIKIFRNEGMVKDKVRNENILSSPIVVRAQILILNFLYILYNVIPVTLDRFNYNRIRYQFISVNFLRCVTKYFKDILEFITMTQL